MSGAAAGRLAASYDHPLGKVSSREIDAAVEASGSSKLMMRQIEAKNALAALPARGRLHFTKDLLARAILALPID